VHLHFLAPKEYQIAFGSFLSTGRYTQLIYGIQKMEKIKYQIQNEKKFWHIIYLYIPYLYIPVALIGIFLFGQFITPSYYTLIFLGVIPFFFLFWNKKIRRGDVKKVFFILYRFCGQL
jgi:hypothetical protein